MRIIELPPSGATKKPSKARASDADPAGWIEADAAVVRSYPPTQVEARASAQGTKPTDRLDRASESHMPIHQPVDHR